MPTVYIKGYDVEIGFPDSMSDGDIQKVLARDYPNRAGKATLGGTDYPDSYNVMGTTVSAGEPESNPRIDNFMAGAKRIIESPMQFVKGFTGATLGQVSGLAGSIQYGGEYSNQYGKEMVGRPKLQEDVDFTGTPGYVDKSPQEYQESDINRAVREGAQASKEYWKGLAEENKVKVESYTDIKSVADGIDYGMAGLGNLASSVAFTMLMPGAYKPAEIAGVTATQAASGGLLKRLGGKAVEFLTPSRLHVPIGLMEGSAISGKQLDEYEKNGTPLAPGRLLATTALATALEGGIGVEAGLARFARFGPEARKYAEKKLFSRMTQGGLVKGFEEGGQEALQSAVENYGGKPSSLFTRETLDDMINSGLQGMIGGHVMGVGGGAMARRTAASLDQAQRAQQEVLMSPVPYDHPQAAKLIENRVNVAKHLEDYIAETNPELARVWGEQAAASIGKNEPIDMMALTDSGLFEYTDFRKEAETKAAEAAIAADVATDTPLLDQIKDPIATEMAENKRFKPLLDKVTAKLNSGEWTTADLPDIRQTMIENYGEEHPIIRVFDRFIERKNKPPGVQDGIDMVEKALTDPLDDAITGKMLQGTGGAIERSKLNLQDNPSAAPYEAALGQMNRTALDEAQDQLSQFPASDRISVAGITRKQPGMPRQRTTPIDTRIAAPASPLGNTYTADEQRRPLEVAQGWTEKERVHRAIFDSLERKEVVPEAILDRYFQEGGAIPAGRDDLAEKYPTAMFVGDIDAKAHEAATSPQNGLSEPTKGQIQAGNYRKGHIQNLHGLDITIENPKGSFRTGTSPDGKAWRTKLKSHYGYIKKSLGADGDHLDTFVGPHPESQKVFVVYQTDPKTGKFDEHKVMLGFNDIKEARAGYLENYEKGWKGLGTIVPMTMDSFKAWMEKLPATFSGTAVHATTESFEKFDDKHIKDTGSHGVGHYFSDSVAYGEEYGESQKAHTGKDYRIVRAVFKNLNLLSLDKPLTAEQRDTIGSALEDLGTSINEILEASRAQSFDKNWSAADYAQTDTLVFALDAFMGARQTSEFLHSLGFHGSRYMERGATNYVIFTADDIASVETLIDNRLKDDTIGKEETTDGTANTRTETNASEDQGRTGEVQGRSGEREVQGSPELTKGNEGTRSQEETGRAELKPETPPAAETPVTTKEKDSLVQIKEPFDYESVKDYQVEVTGYRKGTGQEVKYKESADVALKDIDNRLDTLNKLLECVK